MTCLSTLPFCSGLFRRGFVGINMILGKLAYNSWHVGCEWSLYFAQNDEMSHQNPCESSDISLPMPCQQFSPQDFPERVPGYPLKNSHGWKNPQVVLDAARLAQSFLRSCLAISTSPQELGKVQPFLGDVGWRRWAWLKLQGKTNTTPAQQKRGGVEASRITVLLCFESWWHSCSKYLVFTTWPLQKVYQNTLKRKTRNRESHSSERRIHLAPVLSRFRCFMFHPPNIWSQKSSKVILQ